VGVGVGVKDGGEGCVSKAGNVRAWKVNGTGEAAVEQVVQGRQQCMVQRQAHGQAAAVQRWSAGWVQRAKVVGGARRQKVCRHPT
jgi:hypothetical protein